MPTSASYGSPGDSPQQTPSSLVVRHPKRRGVALSCAECRRLKLKCSRSFPCSNCVKKGCAAICPEGSLTTGKGNRFVLANTEALHEKIAVLSTRVRQLEDGLTSAHALTSHQPHPLLSEDLLQIKRPLERERVDAPPAEGKPETGDAIDSLGSLSISQDGRATFFGTTANSWYLLQNEEGSEEEGSPGATDAQDPSPAPNDIPWLSYAFPFAAPVGQTAETVRSSIAGKLPSARQARRLCDLYFRHAAWMYTPISEQDFHDSIFRYVYDLSPAPSVSSSSLSSMESLSAQNLSVLFLVLAIGSLLDLDKPAHNPEAIQYYQLGRAALSIESVLEEQGISSIQALLLMCHFMFLSEMGGPRWVLMGMVVKLAQSVGLHRDSGKWKLNPEQTQKRRELFYELLTYDSWQSLTFGRPPSLSAAHIDNQFPHEPTKSESGELEMSFATWKHRFSAQCLSVVHDQAFGTRTPNYKIIQDLDRKVREWYVPPSLQVPGFGGGNQKPMATAEVEQPSVQLTMQRYIAFAIREITLFYMHRGFFAQAFEDNPVDPMGSKYSPSVLAAYTSATSFVGLIQSLFNQHPGLTERMWFLFTHVFSCAIVLGSVAAKSNMGLARSALSHLDTAYSLFERVSDHARAGKILPILRKLRERARLAQGNTVLPIRSEGATRLSFYGPTIKSEVDEFSALGGTTRLVARRTSISPSVSTSSPQSHHSPPPMISGPRQMYDSSPENASSWQNYTHIQNFNVNINLGEGYSNNSPLTPSPQADMTGMYQFPLNMQQQPNQQQQQHHHDRAQQGMLMDMSHPDSYFAYNGGGYGNGSANGYTNHNLVGQNMAPSPEVATPTHGHDLHDSWQNFMAQYKP